MNLMWLLNKLKLHRNCYYSEIKYVEILLIQLQDTKQEIVWRCCFFLIVSMITKLDDHFNYMNSINGFGNFWALKSISLIKLTEYVIFLLDAFLFVFVHVCRIIISKIYKIYKRSLFFLLFCRQIAQSSCSKENKLQQHCEWWGADLWPGGIRRGLQQHWQPQHQKCWHERQLSCPAPSSEYTHIIELYYPPPQEKKKNMLKKCSWNIFIWSGPNLFRHNQGFIQFIFSS